MNVTAVESSTLARVGYDPDHEVLQLEFRSGSVYRYFEVPETVHQALLDAPSKGRYFNYAIRGRFLYHPIPDFDAVPSEAEVPGRCGC